MLETHPFGCFVPKGAMYLLLGSFIGKYAGRGQKEYDWFYGSKRNQFWKILEKIYNRRLVNKGDKQRLFTDLSTKRSNICIIILGRENRSGEKNSLQNLS